MSFHSFDEARFKNWERGIARDCQQPGWDAHDRSLREAESTFKNFHLRTAGYIGPRWQLLKAMIWVESGGPSAPYWKSRPMQVGNATDAGMIDVLTHPNMSLVTPPEIRRSFTALSIGADPRTNIYAGIALLHLKFARFSNRIVREDSKPSASAASNLMPYKRISTDKLNQLSKTPFTHSLRGETYISNWLPFTPITLFMLYNLGDAAYARKLEFCLQLIQQQHKH